MKIKRKIAMICCTTVILVTSCGMKQSDVNENTVQILINVFDKVKAYSKEAVSEGDYTKIEIAEDLLVSCIRYMYINNLNTKELINEYTEAYDAYVYAKSQFSPQG